MSVLALNAITHRYGDVVAVNDASLDVDSGEIVCLFGPSGCGKTTLLRLVAGLERLQSGSVAIDGAPAAGEGFDTPPEDRSVGFVFQDFVLFPHLTVLQNVMFGLSGGARRERRERAREELRLAAIDGFEERYPHELSGGQQQRVAIARCFARRPRALLLDEPFASIDTVLRRRLRDELRVLLKQRGAAAIIVTHDPEEALALGDRIALMAAGAIIEVDAPAALFRAPKTPAGAAIFPGSETLAVHGVEDGAAITAFGRIPFARDSMNAIPKCAVVRSDAAQCAIDPNGAARVVDVRVTGPRASVLIESLREPGRLMRLYSLALPTVGERVRLECVLDGVFYF